MFNRVGIVFCVWYAVHAYHLGTYLVLLLKASWLYWCALLPHRIERACMCSVGSAYITAGRSRGGWLTCWLT